MKYEIGEHISWVSEDLDTQFSPSITKKQNDIVRGTIVRIEEHWIIATDDNDVEHIVYPCYIIDEDEQLQRSMNF